MFFGAFLFKYYKISFGTAMGLWDTWENAMSKAWNQNDGGLFMSNFLPSLYAYIHDIVSLGPCLQDQNRMIVPIYKAPKCYILVTFSEL